MMMMIVVIMMMMVMKMMMINDDDGDDSILYHCIHLYLSIHLSQQLRVSHVVKRPVSVTRKVPHDL